MTCDSYFWEPNMLRYDLSSAVFIVMDLGQPLV